MNDTTRPRLSRGALNHALAAMGLPRALRFQVLGQRDLSALWRVDLVDGRAFVLRQELVSTRSGGINHEAAALPLARAAGLAVASSCVRLADDVFGRPSSLVPLVPGRDGALLIERHRRAGPWVFRALGHVMRRLREYELPEFGLHATTECRFVARELRWRDEWRRLVRRSILAATRAGRSLGALGRDLEARLEDRLPALDTAQRWSLVHHDLQPANMLFESKRRSVTLMGIIDWERAFVGDSLAEWAVALDFPDRALAEIVRGYGADAVRELLVPERMARLEVYALSRCLMRLGGSVVFERAHGAWMGAVAREFARAKGEELLGDGAPAARLWRALDAGAGRSRGVKNTMVVDLSAALVRHVIERFQARGVDVPTVHAETRALALGEHAAASRSAAMQGRWLGRARTALTAQPRKPTLEDSALAVAALDRVRTSFDPHVMSRFERTLRRGVRHD